MDKPSIQANQVVRRRFNFVSVGSAVEYIDDTIVRSGDILILDRVAVENETSSFTKLRLGVLSGGIFYPSEEQKNPSVGTLYWVSDSIVIAEGENLRIELTGCTSGDKVALSLFGIMNENKKRGA